MKLKLDKPATELTVDNNNTDNKDHLSKSANAVASSTSKFPAKDIERLRLLKHNLTRHYRDAPARLNVHSIPPCLFNLKHCATNHHSSKDPAHWQPRAEVITISTQLLSDGHYSQFILYARDCILRRCRFPGTRIIRAILEAILNSPAAHLSSLCHILQTIFLNFPICQWRSCYLSLIESSPTKLAHIAPDNSADSTIFEIVLNLLNDLIYQKKRSQVSIACADKSPFINLPCDEKFERIHLVLDALAGLFERDLTMFAVKYAGQLSARIGKSPSHRPLICAAAWKSYESVTAISRTLRVIIAVYSDMIAMRHASVDVIARLLNLIVAVVNMYECCDESTGPSYGQLTVVLAREIHKILQQQDKFQHASKLEFIVDAIGKLRTPLIKMLLTNEVLEKLHNAAQHAISLSTPLRLVRECDEFLQKFNSTRKSPRENDTSEPKRQRLRSAEKHSASQTRRAIRPSEITEDCYLKLLLLFASSINHFYQLSSCYTDSTPVPVKLELAAPQNLPANCRSIKDDDDEEVAVELGELLPHRRRYLVPKKSCSIKLTYETISFYSDEVRQLNELTNLIKKCQREQRGKFDEWLKQLGSV